MNSLILGDCLEAPLPIDAQLVYADPPYGRGSLREGRRASYSDILSGKPYQKWLVKRLRRVFSVVKEGWLCLHHCPEMDPKILVALESSFGKVYGQIIWQDAWVSGFKSKAQFWPRVFDVLHFWRVGNPHFEVSLHNAPEGYKRWLGGESKTTRPDPSVWIGPWSPSHVIGSKEKTGYPDQKPVKLLERIIRSTTLVGDTVIDPFCGSGTTAVASKKLNRFYHCLDQNPKAIKIASRRIRKTQPGFGI